MSTYTIGATPGCECGTCEALRAKSRRLDKLRKLGRGAHATEAEFAAAIAHLSELAVAGFAYSQIARRSGVAESTLSRYRNGGKGMERVTYDRIMSVQPGDRRPPPLKRGGAETDATGTRRRLVALHTLGFSYRWMSLMLGYKKTTGNHLAAIVRVQNDQRTVNFDLYRDVKALYDKYQTADALRFDRKDTVNRSRKHAAGLPGPLCWDEDTIDDPDAIPNWTGACGTLVGQRRHQAWGIPLCKPCANATHERKYDG